MINIVINNGITEYPCQISEDTTVKELLHAVQPAQLLHSTRHIIDGTMSENGVQNGDTLTFIKKKYITTLYEHEFSYGESPLYIITVHKHDINPIVPGKMVLHIFENKESLSYPFIDDILERYNKYALFGTFYNTSEELCRLYYNIYNTSKWYTVICQINQVGALLVTNIHKLGAEEINENAVPKPLRLTVKKLYQLYE